MNCKEHVNAGFGVCCEHCLIARIENLEAQVAQLAEMERLREVLADAFREVTEADGWNTPWWAEDWVPRAERALKGLNQ